MTSVQETKSDLNGWPEQRRALLGRGKAIKDKLAIQADSAQRVHEAAVQATKSKFYREHEAVTTVLRERGIEPAQAALQKFRYLTAPGHFQLMGNQQLEIQQIPGLLIPYFDSKGTKTDYYRTKLLAGMEPTGRSKKAPRYLAPSGSSNHLYLPRGVDWQRVFADPTCPVVVTEGELKTVKLVQEGYATIGLAGVWCWRTREDDESEPLRDFADIVWEARRVFIVFDSDAAFNRNVLRARDALERHLFERGADPFVVSLPHTPGLSKTGVDDFFVLHGEGARAKFEALLSEATSSHVLKTQSSLEIMALDPTQQPTGIVSGLLAPGLNILAGRPKKGKSWKALSLAHSIATGAAKGLAHFSIQRQAKVLYLALEDTPYRIRGRLKILGVQAHPNLEFAYGKDVKRGSEGCEMLDRWCKRNPDSVVVIDVWKKFRGVAGGNKGGGNAYDSDYEDTSALKAIADRHNVTILVLHHVRKPKTSDIIDAVSGTFGIAGGVDTIIVLERDGMGKEARLHVTGRDIEDAVYQLRFEDGRWTCTGAAEPGDEDGPNAAQTFLRTFLSGGPRPRAEVFAAGEKQKFGRGQLDRAAEVLGLVRERTKKFGAETVWALPA